MQHDRLEEAVDVIAKLEGAGIGHDHPNVVRQSEEIVASVQQEAALGEASWAEVFTEGKNRNLSRVLLGAGPYM